MFNPEKQSFQLETQEENKVQQAERMANVFFDKLDILDTQTDEGRQEYERTQSVAQEIAEGNYPKAQEILEVDGRWNDELRTAATEINQLVLENNGDAALSFMDARNAIEKYAQQLEEISRSGEGNRQDFETAMDIRGIARKTWEPGVEGIEGALTYIESTLKRKSSIAGVLKDSEYMKDVQEKRSIRDALYREKQKRITELHKARNKS